MFFKKKKSSADKAFELCADLLIEVKKQGRMIEALSTHINGIKDTLTTLKASGEKNVDEIKSAQTNIYSAVKETQDNVCESNRMVSELKKGIFEYNRKSDESATAAQILDEYLNGENSDE